MSDNLRIYEAVREVPIEAQKPIPGGRLKGMTDISPMWRIKTLTEQFGLCGIGWKYIITDKRLEHGGNGEIAAFVDIELFVKVDGEWSCAIPGTGGSSFVANETRGLYVSDECFKMALTDAISVACKALGFGADIYWQKDNTKYTKADEKPTTAPTIPPTDSKVTLEMLQQAMTKAGKTKEQLITGYEKETGKKISDINFISQEYKQKYYKGMMK